MVLGIIIAVVVLAMIGGVVFFALSRRRSTVEERLGQFTQAGQAVAPAAGSQEVAEGPRPSFLADRLNQALAGRGFAENISRELARADLKLTVGEYLALHVIVAFGLFAAVWFLKGPL